MEPEYSLDEKVIIFLSSFEFMTWHKMDAILSLFKQPSLILGQFNVKSEEIKQILGTENFNNLNVLFNISYINALIHNLTAEMIVCVTYISSNYPEKLKNIDCPPFCLYTKGDLSLMGTRGIAVVGTRKISAYGKSITKDFTKGLVKNGFTIVSGMALGVDTIAHETALEEDGKTIAVLGAGFNNIYPAQNYQLSKNIARYGLIISEYCPSERPNFYNFPFRNRIIAGLSEAVLITEAGEKSGALHTKEAALELGKEVFAIPGNIYSQQSKGTNRLIKSAQCACVTSYEDILTTLGVNKIVKEERVKYQLNMTENSILKVLEDGEKHFDEIISKTKLDSKTLNSCLTTLQIRGIIKKLSGNYYSL